MRTLKGPKAKLKNLVRTHTLKEDHFNNHKSHHQEKTDKRHHFPLYLINTLHLRRF